MLRQLTKEDVQQVLSVQVRAYRAELVEPESSFLDKMSLFPQGAVGHFERGSLIGYLFCFPWTLGEIVPLSSEHLRPPLRPDCLYVHDLAVDPLHRGEGVGASLVERAIGIAREAGLGNLALVAVQGSERFWKSHGFQAMDRISYHPGVGASYMVRKVS